jgi:hypothetical protein
MQFLDREREMSRLETFARRAEGGLAVVWGRRRVGKTRLLLEWGRRHDGLYTVADQSAAIVQRRYLAESLAGRFPGFAEVDYPDWRSLFRAVARAARQRTWRGPLILDEFPYLAASDPGLASVLQAWIDHEAAEAHLLVVLAGSAQHMMQGLVLEESAPLYGRASEILPLAPLPPSCLRRALKLRKATDVVRAFAAWGGIPRYWELAQPARSDLDSALDALVFDPLGPLHREPERLLSADLPSSLALRPLLDAVGAGAHRPSEIAGRLGMPLTSLSKPLARLVQLGLLRREQPLGDSERGGKKTLYKIEDPFLRLWFRVVAPHQSQLSVATPAQRLALWRRHEGVLLSQVWEDLCRSSVPGLSRCVPALRAHGAFLPAGRVWGSGGPEWDVVSLSEDGQALLLGECKWQARRPSAATQRKIVESLVEKGRPRGKRFAEPRLVHAVFAPFAPTARKDALWIDVDGVLAGLEA